MAADHPKLRENAVTSATPSTVSNNDLPPLFKLIYRAHYLIAHGFEENRREEGLTISQNYVLFGLADNPSISCVECHQHAHRPTLIRVADLPERPGPLGPSPVP